MTVSTTGRPPASARDLWRRAPLWRLCVYLSTLLILLSVCFPPHIGPPPAAAPPTLDSASYVSRSPATPAVDAQPPNQTAHATAPLRSPLSMAPAKAAIPRPVVVANTAPPISAAPRTAILSMASASQAANAGKSGIDPGLMGRAYHDEVMVDGFKLPLPKGDWSMLANGTIHTNKDPSNQGMIYFLGRIENKTLVGMVIVTAMRSPNATGFANFEICGAPQNIFTMKEEMTEFGHQACWIQRSLFTTLWQQWADKATNLDNLVRAAAGDMAAKGVIYPQDFVAVRFYRGEAWGKLDAAYVFSPDAENIQSSTVLTGTESDWFATNIHRFPDKVAYAQKLQDWGASFWPTFKQAFDAGR